MVTLAIKTLPLIYHSYFAKYKKLWGNTGTSVQTLMIMLYDSPKGGISFTDLGTDHIIYDIQKQAVKKKIQ